MTSSPQVIELQEYALQELSRTTLREADAELLDQKYGAQIQIEPPSFRNNYQWKLMSQGWVGYIPLTADLNFRLTPKVELANLFGMWEYAFRLKSFHFLADLISVQSLEEFYEQLANVLSKRVLDRARKGFYRTYLSDYDSLPYVRGRLDARHTIRSSWDISLACHFEEHTADIVDNQLLAYTLWRIARSGVCSERVLPTIRKAYRSLMGLTSLEPFTASQCIGRTYNRLNQDYHPMHALSRFFLEQTGPTHKAGDRQIMPFLVDMARLFELFVAEWLNAHLPEGWQVKAQERIHFGNSGNRHFEIDLVLVNVSTGESNIVLDTKYKVPDEPSNSDISQVIAYAEATGCHEAVLIYPTRLNQPIDDIVGDIRVRSLTFALDGDLETAGQTFLADLGIKGEVVQNR